MKTLRAFGARLARDDRGGAIVEYGILVGVVAIGLIAVMTTLETSIDDLFGRIEADIATIAADGD